MNSEGTGLGKPKQTSYVGFRIFLALFSLFFLTAGISMTLTLGRRFLEKQDWTAVIFVIVPVLFAVLGACGVYAAFFLVPWREKVSSSISAKASPITASMVNFVRLPGYAFFGIFLAAGLGALLSGCVIPVARIVEAMTWPQAPCVILDRGITREKTDDGFTYHVTIRYRFEAAGREVTSERFAPVDKPLTSEKAARNVLKQYPRASESLCYVNPLDPARSVLTLGGFPGAQALLGLLGLTFMAVGAGGIYVTATKTGAWQQKLEDREKRGSPLAAAGGPLQDDTWPHREHSQGWILKPKETRWGRFFTALLFTVVWNGFVGMFGWLWWSGEHSSIPWWGAVLIGVFVIFGLLLVWGLGGAVLALFAPHPEISVDRRQIRLGEPFCVSWRFIGSERYVPNLNLYMEGIEEVRSGAGSDMKTDTRTFVHIPVATASGQAQFVRGSQTITLPMNSMHSFKGDHNAVQWVMRLKADIKGTRSLDETFEIQVGPLPAELWKLARDEAH